MNFTLGNPLPIMSWYAMTQQQSQSFADGELELTDDLIQGKVALFTDEKYLVEQKVGLRPAMKGETHT